MRKNRNLRSLIEGKRQKRDSHPRFYNHPPTNSQIFSRYRQSRFSRLYLSAEPPERKPRAQLTEKAPNPPSFCRKKVPSFVLGRRWSPAPAGKFSPHAGAATHGNGISKLATHPPQHADAPSLQLAAVVLSPFPSHRRG